MNRCLYCGRDEDERAFGNCPCMDEEVLTDEQFEGSIFIDTDGMPKRATRKQPPKEGE